MKKSILISFVLSLACLMLTTFAFGQAMPKPGDVIDKSNYKQYAHLIPQEFFQGFEDGFGLFQPWVMKIVAWRSAPQPKSYLDLSERNRGKYSIDKDGSIAGGFDYIGLPFPDLRNDDKDFATKFMYNQYYCYDIEGMEGLFMTSEKRRGESVTATTQDFDVLYFINRLIDSPKPTYTPNPLGYCNTSHFLFHTPEGNRNMQLLLLSYLDQRKSDETYVYLPTMRRVIRGDASQRSTPVVGSATAPDDYNGGFNGKVQDFTYKFLGEQKVLGSVDSPMDKARFNKLVAEAGNRVFFSKEGYSVRDAYVIEIKSKDPKYPQGRKVIYVDKENYKPLYCMAWDRAGKLWKIWTCTRSKLPMPNGEMSVKYSYQSGLDVQVGYANSGSMEMKYYGTGLRFSDYLPAALLKRVQ